MMLFTPRGAHARADDYEAESVKRPTRASSSSARPASSWAAAAICCTAALVCCVLAETSSVEADVCSATEATSPMSVCTRLEPVGGLVDGGGDVGGAQGHLLDGGADGLERLAGALDGGRAVGAAPRAVLDDVDRVARLGLDGADERGDRAGGRARLLGELADLLGDDGEAAALLARARRLDGGVEREQVGLRGDAR